MKICFIVGAFPNMKCGVGDYTHKLAEELAKKGNEVHIITSIKANSKSNTLHIHNIVDKWTHKETKTIIKKLKEICPDVVNVQYPSHEYTQGRMIIFLPLHIKLKLKCKVTITIHEYRYLIPDIYGKRRLKTKIKFYLSFCKLDKIIVVEERFVDMAKKDYKNENVVFIPISTNIPRSNITLEKKEELINKYDLRDKKIISYFGFAIQEKGIEYLLQCIYNLGDDVKLLFINELNENNEYQKSLLDLIDRLGIKEKVVITGFFDSEKDVADMLQISDVCVLPFTQGVRVNNGSFLAAYNQKISVITTRREAEKDGNGIYYVTPRQEDELLEKIKFVLKNNEEIQRDILTWDSVATEYLKNFR